MKNKELKKVLTYLFLGIFGIVMLFPVIWMFFACFKTNNEIFGSLRILPQGWSMEAFVKGWKTTGTYTYAKYFINTFALVIPTTLLTLASCSLVAYGFARFDFPGNQFLFMILIATLMLPNAVIIIPRYALFNKLGWLDSYMTFFRTGCGWLLPVLRVHAGTVFKRASEGFGRIGLYRRLRTVSVLYPDSATALEAGSLLRRAVPVFVDVE